MLGMMNCPTDSVEFYSASPSMKRSIEERGGAAATADRLARLGLAAGNGANASSSSLDSSQSLPSTATTTPVARTTANSAGSEKAASDDSDSDVVRVFSEARDKPHFVYTADGRKMVEGQLSADGCDPVRMWNRLILDSVVTSRVDAQRRRTHSTGAADVTVTCVDGHCKLSSTARSESVNVVAPTVVNAARPQPAVQTKAAPMAEVEEDQ